MRSRSGHHRWVPVVVATLALVALSSIGWAAWAFGGLDPSTIPSRLRIYGRTYRAPDVGGVVAVDSVAARCPLPPCAGVLEPALGYWPVVMPWDHPTMAGDRTLMRVFLRIAPDRYRAYDIVGGP